MGMYQQFKTNEERETSGIELDYGDFKITVAAAYAGSANKAFARALEAKTRPLRRAIANEALSAEQSEAILRDVYAEAVVLKWETKVDGKYVSGIEGPNGDLLPDTKANRVQVFAALPQLYIDVKEQTGKAVLFRDSIREGLSGN